MSDARYRGGRIVERRLISPMRCCATGCEADATACVEFLREAPGPRAGGPSMRYPVRVWYCDPHALEASRCSDPTPR